MYYSLFLRIGEEEEEERLISRRRRRRSQRREKAPDGRPKFGSFPNTVIISEREREGGLSSCSIHRSVYAHTAKVCSLSEKSGAFGSLALLLFQGQEGEEGAAEHNQVCLEATRPLVGSPIYRSWQTYLVWKTVEGGGGVAIQLFLTSCSRSRTKLTRHCRDWLMCAGIGKQVPVLASFTIFCRQRVGRERRTKQRE